MAKFDPIILGGRVLDPTLGIDGVRDLAVKKGAIVPMPRSQSALLEEQVPEAA